MRFSYSATDAAQDEFDALPRLPFRLRHSNRVIDVVGLVDSGATSISHEVERHTPGLRLRRCACVGCAAAGLAVGGSSLPHNNDGISGKCRIAAGKRQILHYRLRN